MNYYFTSESVSMGHPDKVADQISDAILDEALRQDKESRVACETLVTTGQVVVAGEITTHAYVDIPDVVRKTIVDIGYNKGEYLFDGNSCGIFSAIHEQSPDISQGVDRKTPQEQGAGDQGMVFGYAVKDGIEYMPLEVMLSRMILDDLTSRRILGLDKWLRPDAKAQVTIEYDEDTHKPLRVDTVLVSTQHDPDVANETIVDLVETSIATITSQLDTKIINLFYDEEGFERFKLLVNPTGRFVIGGPAGDTGLTGRKIVVDTYGGHCPHGGGAFSGKDPSKVDRSAAYFARYIAKNLVAAGVCDECTIQIAYAIGRAKPISVFIDTHNTSHVAFRDSEIAKMLKLNVDFTPYSIINKLALKNPIYLSTAKYGHFGHTSYFDESVGCLMFPWENTDMVVSLKEWFNIG